MTWIDCVATGGQLGRSLIALGHHLPHQGLRSDQHDRAFGTTSRRPLRGPVDFPGFALNRWSIKAFNKLYYRRELGTILVPLDAYLYPLDSLLDWNRICGPAGFLQYQFLLSKHASREGLQQRILSHIAACGGGSLPRHPETVRSRTRVPVVPHRELYPGTRLSRHHRELQLMTMLDSIVGDYGGRVYLAKDARLGADLLRRGYPGLEAFSTVRTRSDPRCWLASLQSQRFGL